MTPNEPIVGLVASKRQAERILMALEGAGLARDDLSVLFVDNPARRGSAGRMDDQTPEGASAPADGAPGPLTGVESIAISDTGPFIATGPIMLALSGAATAAAADGIAGALVRVGIDELDAQQYEARIRGGGVLVSVHVDDHEERLLAKAIFSEGRAVVLSVEGEHGISSQQRAASNLGRLNR